MRHLRKRLLAVALCGCLFVGILPACSSKSSSSTTTTQPRLEFPVGISSFDFVDTTRSTPAGAGQPGQPSRSLSVRVWYPALAPALDAAQDDDFASIADPTPQFNAPPATGSGPFPLIVFAHGFGATPAQYGDLLASWAAAGYVVAAPALSSSNQISPGKADAGEDVNQPGDLSAVLTRAIVLTSSAEGGFLAGMVDGARIGLVGHSNGGIAVAEVLGRMCCVDERVDAAVIIAGTSQSLPEGTVDWSATPPLLIVHGENDAVIPYEEGVRLFARVRSPKGLLTILGSDHNSYLFSDSKAFPITVTATLDFLNGYVKSDASAIAALPQDQQTGIARMVFSPG